MANSSQLSFGARPILSVRRLTVERPVGGVWPWRRAHAVRVVDDVHLNLHAGETLGIVGEAGCGKTTLARAIVGLQPIASGGIVHDGRDLARLDEDDWRGLRRAVQMVFEDARGSLDPHMTIAASVAEPLASLCPELAADTRQARVLSVLEALDVAAHRDRFPRDLSTAECRRVGLARALVVDPSVLICDEPAAGLSGAERDDLLALIAALRRERGLSVIVVSDDLDEIRELCDRVVLMYLGRVMEQAAARDWFARPRHPYARALLAESTETPPAEAGLQIPSGCVFRTRCPIADDLCARETPYLRRVGETGHVACHYVQGDEADGAELREGMVGKARRSVASA